MADEDTGARLYDGGIVFRMRAGVALDFVTVWVTDEALDNSEHSRKAHSDRIGAFGRRRYAIESVARRKIEQKKLQKDGSVLITSADLND